MMFKTLDVDLPEFEIVKKELMSALSPIYGHTNTESLIHKIETIKDRTCELYYEDDVLRGLIVFKKHLSNEYRDLGILDGFEQKTTLPIVPHDKANRRRSLRITVMKRLLHRATENAIAMGAKTFFGTVSDEKYGTLRLLFKLGFEEVQIFPDKFKSGVSEHLLVHKNLSTLLQETEPKPIIF